MVDHHRYAIRGQWIGAIDQPEVQVRPNRVPAVAQPANRLSGHDLIANLDGDTPSLEVRVERPDSGLDHDDVIARTLTWLLERAWQTRRRPVCQAVTRGDDGARGDGSDLGAVGKPVLVPRAIVLE